MSTYVPEKPKAPVTPTTHEAVKAAPATVFTTKTHKELKEEREGHGDYGHSSYANCEELNNSIGRMEKKLNALHVQGITELQIKEVVSAFEELKTAATRTKQALRV